MKATTWHSGAQYGIRVGAANRDRFFDIGWSHIYVEMDGQVQRFELTPGFWRNCPEFRESGNSAIGDWLKKFKSLKWPYRKPPVMSLIQLRDNTFRLDP